MKKTTKRTYSVYFGGELFSLKHLIGNAWLAEAIYEKSHGKYRCLLPQDLLSRGRSGRTIRDQDLRALIGCDLGLFNYDGTELDNGTVVEFMIAKFADIPSVLLRTDLRSNGDFSDEPWNLMTSYFPRTTNVIVPSLLAYSAAMKRRRRQPDAVARLAGQHSSVDAQHVCEQVAAQCVRALDRVLTMEPVMPKHLREEAYHWLSILPGLRGKEKALRKEFEQLLEGKVERDLL